METTAKTYTMDALGLIAMQSKGHLRDSLTLLDKVLSYTQNVTVEAVEKVLGVTSYDSLFKTLNFILAKDSQNLILTLDEITNSGIDLKLFIKNFLQFVLEVNKYLILKTEQTKNLFNIINIPASYENLLNNYNMSQRPQLKSLLRNLIELNSSIRWETNVRAILETNLLLEVL